MIVERRVVFVSGSDRGDCEGVLEPSPWEFTKGISSGLLVACGSHLVLVVRHPIEGLASDAN